MTQRRLHHRALNRSDEVLLRSMLALLQGQTIDEWQLVDGSQDFDLLLMRWPDAGDEAAAALRSHANLHATIGPGAAPGDLELAHPVRPRALAALLDHASGILSQPREARAASTALRSDIAAGIADRTLADLLYELARDPSKAPEAAVCTVDGDELMHIDARHGRVGSHDPAQVIGSASRRGARLVPRNGNGNAVAADQPLAPLLWSIGLACPGALVEPVTPVDLITIRRWPDFGRLPHRSEHVRMTARLARQPISTEQLAIEADQPLGNAIGFVNAMLLGGLATSTAVEPHNRPALRYRAPPPSPRRDLLSRIRARLGL